MNNNLTVEGLLKFAEKSKASDLHLSSGLNPLIRVDGEIIKIPNIPPLSDEVLREMIFDVMNEEQKKRFKDNMETDFPFEIPNLARFRVNAFNQERGISAVFRSIPAEILSLEQLNCPAIFENFAKMHKGIVLVTGPTGSGKSTTLAAIINEINLSRKAHILTIEDPIEFVHTPKKCVINQRQLGDHTISFDNALRSALREDPDVILVGELRDLETIRLALSAAETGHLVFATLHTVSAPKTIDRIIDVFPGNEKDMIRSMLSESLQAVVAQTLLKKEGGGRCAAHEIMLGTSAIRNLIRENKISQMYSVMQTSRDLGMSTLDQNLQKLVAEKIISIDVAISHAINPEDVFPKQK